MTVIAPAISTEAIIACASGSVTQRTSACLSGRRSTRSTTRQTCYVIKNWASSAGSWWISDDGDAIRYAKFQNITTRETIDILSIAVADGDIERPRPSA
jgi:hypothetical protein